MPDYFITGAKGAGKGVINVSKMRRFIWQFDAGI